MRTEFLDFLKEVACAPMRLRTAGLWRKAPVLRIQIIGKSLFRHEGAAQPLHLRTVGRAVIADDIKAAGALCVLRMCGQP